MIFHTCAASAAGGEPKRSTIGCVLAFAFAVAVGELRNGLVLGALPVVGDETLA